MGSKSIFLETQLASRQKIQWINLFPTLPPQKAVLIKSFEQTLNLESLWLITQPSSDLSA